MQDLYDNYNNDGKFYKKAAKYWANVPATIDGVLGGYGHVSDIDIDGSKLFLNNILSLANPPKTNLALDCGAGIGRVSRYLLMPYFLKVDLVEQDEKFINTAKQLIGEDNTKLGTLYQIGLHHFKPEKEYDVIWCQWVIGHLNDCDLITFLERCSKSLAENGVIVVKENICSSDEVEYDEDDSSVTRSHNLMLNIFEEANLRLIKTDLQTGFPEGLYPVHMFALAPKKRYNKKYFRYYCVFNGNCNSTCIYHINTANKLNFKKKLGGQEIKQITYIVLNSCALNN